MTKKTSPQAARTPALAAERTAGQPPPQGHEEDIFSPRLVALLDEIAAARSPNAGRFCGYCYHPLAAKQDLCPHCHRSAAEPAPASRIPREVIEMHKLRRSREGLIVRGTAWGGLTLGVVLSVVPLIAGGATWWSILAFFLVLAFFYVLSVNLANTIGDAYGYAWGQSTLRKRWAAFLARREGGSG